MMLASPLLLVGAVIAVGILHTAVPDHWVPIAVMARQAHWSPARTARTAFVAGLGHTLSTLAIGIVVWAAGFAAAMHFGHLVSVVSSFALIGFGVWIATAGFLELRARDHATRANLTDFYRERPNARTALLVILGSSPMIEGIPAFFAAARFGAGLLGIMALCFGLSTIATYVTLCVYSASALQKLAFAPFERYGEVLSGVVIAMVGIVFLFLPLP
jgi:hypothetical protein